MICTFLFALILQENCTSVAKYCKNLQTFAQICKHFAQILKTVAQIWAEKAIICCFIVLNTVARIGILYSELSPAPEFREISRIREFSKNSTEFLCYFKTDTLA